MITSRMLADNVLVSSVPPLSFAVACALRFDLGPALLLQTIVVGFVWSVLYLYIFDASNQAAGAREDARNKPYRPIPAGLVSVRGMWLRAGVAAVVYLTLSACIGWVTLAAAAVWTTTTVLSNCCASQRHYLYFKPVSMFVGVAAQLAGSWEIAHPLDAMGWWWVLVIAALFCVPLPIEDIRDMAGDRAVGRRTLALIWGPRLIRSWFVAMMLLWPLLAHELLFRGSGADPAAIQATTAAFTALCWFTGLHTLRDQTRRGDRRSYMLYSGVHLALVAAALVLLT